MWFIIVLGARTIVVGYPILAYYKVKNEAEFTYREIYFQTIIVRASLGINLINLLPDLLIKTTLVWEPAAMFYDLLGAVFSSLIPLVVFIGYIGVTFIFLFYTIGQHQMTFDFHSDENLASMTASMNREYEVGDDPGEER